MNVLKKKFRVTITNEELIILKVIHNIGPCNPSQVTDMLPVDKELLFVMRTMHYLVDKGFLERVEVNRARLYKTKPNFKNIHNYLRR